MADPLFVRAWYNLGLAHAQLENLPFADDDDIEGGKLLESPPRQRGCVVSTDNDGAVVDLTSMTLEFSAQDTFTATPLVTVSATATATDATNGVMEVAFAQADTSSLAAASIRRLHFTLEGTPAAGEPRVLATGILHIVEPAA